MKPVLYLIKTFPINFTNLFLANVCHSCDRILGPCYYNITPGGNFDLVVGKTAQFLTSRPESHFRNIKWEDTVSKLDTLIHQASHSNKILFFGSHHNDQISFLKKYYQNQCRTIGINYTEADYSFLLNNMAQYHVYMLKNNLLESNSVDKENLIKFDDEQLTNWYRHEFDKMGLIPRSSFVECDYNINIEDFFILEKLKNHYCNLGFDGVDKFEEYYKTWESAQ